MGNKTLDQDRQYQLWWLIRHTRWAMQRAREKELYHYQISNEDSAVLFAVRTIGDEATPAKISRFVMREPHTVSGQLDRMVKKGLLTKTKDFEKKNMVRVAITEKGQRVYEKAAKRESIHRIMSSISDSDCEHLFECLQTLLNKALKDADIKSKPGLP
ncbi:MarR family winged helix-turn-helix transcriptional regulator [Chloroflexota bacterium]